MLEKQQLYEYHRFLDEAGIDIYDTDNYSGNRNYYNKNNKLSNSNIIK